MSGRKLAYHFIGLKENIKGFGRLVDTFYGWHRFVLLRHRIVDTAVLDTKNKNMNLKRMKISNISKTIGVFYRDKEIRFSFGSLKQLDNAMRNIYEIFLAEQYRMLDVEGKSVVDIGANNGDSAIYFATNGAKKIYAYEPYPLMYRWALKNIRMNGMQNRIRLYNEAVLKDNGKMVIDDKYESVSNTMLKGSATGKSIRLVSLDKVAEKNRLRRSVLKIDCEGGEYDIVSGASDKTLNRFGEIVIEYHFGYGNLVNRLRKLGFKVSATTPKTVRNSETDGTRMAYGMIFAKK